jgi:hypothetical protein
MRMSSLEISGLEGPLRSIGSVCSSQTAQNNLAGGST